MKLLLCKVCQDVVRPLVNKERSCECGACKIVAHDDNLTVTYSGEKAVLIGFKNSSLVEAVSNQPETGLGREFVAFVLPKKCVSIIKKV